MTKTDGKRNKQIKHSQPAKHLRTIQNFERQNQKLMQIGPTHWTWLWQPWFVHVCAVIWGKAKNWFLAEHACQCSRGIWCSNWKMHGASGFRPHGEKENNSTGSNHYRKQIRTKNNPSYTTDILRFYKKWKNAKNKHAYSTWISSSTGGANSYAKGQAHSAMPPRSWRQQIWNRQRLG